MKKSSTARRKIRWVLVVAVLVLVAAFPGGLWLALRLGLPSLDGAIVSPDVEASLTLRRDETGIVSVHAASQNDAAWALGYAHGQDRFFQMDTLRRLAAGELGELYGSSQIGADIAARRWRLRALAREQLGRTREVTVAIVRAYTAGVNAGLRSLQAKPIEYIVLRTQPEPWQGEDCILTLHAMFLMLTDPTASREQFLDELKQSVAPDVFNFLTWSEGVWDSSFIDVARHDMPPIPIAGAAPDHARKRSSGPVRMSVAGSNAWAVSGRKTKHSQAMLAVDMHLPLSMPNIWYRAELHVAQRPDDAARSVYGLTLPGFPGVVVGSNEHIAWGLSNVQGDWSDVLALDPCDSHGAAGYKVDSECVPFDVREEIIKVAHGSDVAVRIPSTRWGPLVDPDRLHQPAAFRWLGGVPGAVNLRFMDLSIATDVPGAIEIARASGMPPVNFIVADSAGNIGWTIAGQLPNRTDACAIGPQPATAVAVDDWARFKDPGAHLRVMDPADGYLVTANQRIVPDAEALVCDGAYQLGARAQQIARSLSAATPLDETAAMKIQLDDRAFFLERWRDLLMTVVADRPRPEDRRYETLSARLKAWDGHASTDSVAYRFIREFRDALSRDILAMLAGKAGFSGRELYMSLPHAEYPVWKIVSEQPRAWLPKGFTDWHSYIRKVLDRVLSEYQMRDPELTDLTWGKRNVLLMRNPVLSNVPLVGRYFALGGVELPGDMHMPRVQTPDFGASQRLVVAPGREQDGILTMPGGQSSNPLSEFYRAGHEQWVHGEPMPLIAGKTRHEITVRPLPER